MGQVTLQSFKLNDKIYVDVDELCLFLLDLAQTEEIDNIEWAECLRALNRILIEGRIRDNAQQQ